MAETKQILTVTNVSSINDVLDIYTYYEAVAAEFLEFFTTQYASVVNETSFVEGELGYTKETLPDFSAVLSAIGELLINDLDTSLYTVDGLGAAIYDGILLPPVLSAVTDIVPTGFTINWQASTGATSYTVDVSKDSQFNSYESTYQNLNVGNVLTKVITGLTDSDNYYYRVRAVNAIQTSLDSVVQNVITMLTLTVTAQAASKTYGSANGALTVVITGYIDGDDASDLTVVPTASTTVITGSPAGVYVGAITASGGVDEKYAFNYIAGTYTVLQKSLDLTLIPISKKYDGNTTAETYAYLTTPAQLVGADVVTVSTSSGVFDNATLGTGKTVTANAVLNGADAANYTCASPITSSLGVICNARIYIHADSKSYDGNHNVIITFAWAEPADLIYGSDVTIGASAGRFIDKYIGNGKPVWAQVSCVGGTSCPNYTWMLYAKTTANIT
jgi:hypothetical protein